MQKRDARSPEHNSARAEHLGRCSGCSEPSDALQRRTGAMVMTWKINPGQDFKWEELWSETGVRKEDSVSERNTARATRMSKWDNYQEFTEALVQSWDRLYLIRDGSGGARSKLQVKSWNAGEFTGF